MNQNSLLYSPEQIETIVVAVVAQITCNPEKRPSFPSGVFATSVALHKEFSEAYDLPEPIYSLFESADPANIQRFRPVDAGSFECWDSSRVEIADLNDGTLLVKSQGSEVAQLASSDGKMFVVTDLINGTKYRAATYVNYPLSIEILPQIGESDWVRRVYKIGLESF